MEHVFHVQGMTCAHCERAITAAVQALDTQAHVTIDRAARRVQVRSSSASAPALRAAIAEAGYPVD